ncbi:MAG: hypothetical protein N2Z60_00990, partial [Elusimicrobiales bacterium]|nr:hypothetical protein [Elusimicrobiales bacterium]
KTVSVFKKVMVSKINTLISVLFLRYLFEKKFIDIRTKSEYKISGVFTSELSLKKNAITNINNANINSYLFLEKLGMNLSLGKLNPIITII